MVDILYVLLLLSCTCVFVQYSTRFYIRTYVPTNNASRFIRSISLKMLFHRINCHSLIVTVHKENTRTLSYRKRNALVKLISVSLRTNCTQQLLLKFFQWQPLPLHFPSPSNLCTTNLACITLNLSEKAVMRQDQRAWTYSHTDSLPSRSPTKSGKLHLRHDGMISW